MKMAPNKSIEQMVSLFAALLTDAHKAHDGVFNARALKLTLNQVDQRTREEGTSFLTKTLPRLGKALDKALSTDTRLVGSEHRFDTMPGSELPRFLGEFFSCVFSQDGTELPSPCIRSVRVLRQLLYCFYKYELPFSDEQQQQVIAKFVRTEDDLKELKPRLQEIVKETEASIRSSGYAVSDDSTAGLVRRARILLSEVFRGFDPTDIVPSHGPGAVSTKEKLEAKYRFSNVPDRIAEMYPIDAYYFASLGHVCDSLQGLRALTSIESKAQVLLVPKDSRGPRLISCEPLEFQWIQQGLGRAIVQRVESHPLTRYNVHFTDQQPNQFGSLLGSRHGRYATLDLNEASDRVSVDLVTLLFPEPLLGYLMASRSLSTVLPDGRVLVLDKFAPMGSALCFPILALTVWAILTAGETDADARESILVYGDDVIVETARAARAIEQLEAFGLRVNKDKSCTCGLFRESCGMDAYRGENVTPVRFRTVWSSTQSPEAYVSWIAYANSLYNKHYFTAYDCIVSWLYQLYGDIPSSDLGLPCPSLVEVPESMKPPPRRSNAALQKVQHRVREIKAQSVRRTLPGWSMLLRWFTEARRAKPAYASHGQSAVDHSNEQPFTVSLYTKRRTVRFVRRWR